MRPLMMAVAKASVVGLTELPSGFLLCNSILSSCTALSPTGFLLLFLRSPISTWKRASCMVGCKCSAMKSGPGPQQIVAEVPSAKWIGRQAAMRPGLRSSARSKSIKLVVV